MLATPKEDRTNKRETMLKIKRCGHCKQEKAVDQFSLDRSTKTELRSSCKACEKAYCQTPNYKVSRDRYRQSSKGKATSEAYARTPKRGATNRIYRRAYKQAHRLNPQYKLNTRISALINYSLKGNKNGCHWEDLVGYTLSDLTQHLEALFTDGMTWDNIGKWHIDHKIPLSVFNFSSADDYDFKKCWALNNLQPLWAEENLSKGNKIDGGFKSSLIRTKQKEEL